jgi:hypothetical protein
VLLEATAADLATSLTSHALETPELRMPVRDPGSGPGRCRWCCVSATARGVRPPLAVPSLTFSTSCDRKTASVGINAQPVAMRGELTPRSCRLSLRCLALPVTGDPHGNQARLRGPIHVSRTASKRRPFGPRRRYMDQATMVSANPLAHRIC